MKGKLIVIEGTDCSGKETQTKMLVERLEKLNIKCVRFQHVYILMRPDIKIMEISNTAKRFLVSLYTVSCPFLSNPHPTIHK